MKLDTKLPGGLEIHWEKKPMEKERFEMICYIAFAMIAAWTFIKVISLMT